MARIRRYMGRVELWFDEREKTALLRALEELSGDVARAGDREGGRLRPKAYDDPALEREYQRYSAPEVNALRDADVSAVREDLGGRMQPLRLDDDRALLWLRALNVLRLAGGARLGIEDDGWEDATTVEAGDEETWAMFLDLGWVQEGILSAIEPGG